ncbi:MAG: preprotein translocase subunit YajC, partial [Clostridia bacterium]
VVMTIIPQKKRQKQQQQMMNSLNVGTKIMTIGRMVGKITQVNADNTLIINVGTESSPTLIVIDRAAVGLVLENIAAPVVAPAPVDEAEKPVEDAPVVEDVETPEVKEDIFSDAAPVEEKAEEKKSKKTKAN